MKGGFEGEIDGRAEAAGHQKAGENERKLVWVELQLQESAACTASVEHHQCQGVCSRKWS